MSMVAVHLHKERTVAGKSGLLTVTRHPRLPASVAWTLWAASAGLLIACIPLFLPVLRANADVGQWPFPDPSAAVANFRFVVTAKLLDILVLAAFSTLGALIVTRQPGNVIGWIFCVCGLLGFVELFTLLYTWQSTKVAPSPLPGGLLMAWVNNWIWVLSYGLHGVFLPLLFPTGRYATGLWRLVGRLAWLAMGITLAGAAFHPGPLYNAAEPLELHNPLALDGTWGRAIEWIGIGGFVLLNLAVLAATIGLFVRLRHEKGEERQQLKWLLYFIAIAALLLVSQFLLRHVLDIRSPVYEIGSLLLMGAALVGLPVATGLAILRHRLWDIDRLISRTLVYASLTALVIAIYVLAVGLLSVFLRPASDLFLSLLATGMVAVIFHPLRERLQRNVDRLMFGQRDDPVEMLTQLAQQLEAGPAPAAILDTLVQTIATALKLPHVAIWLRQGNATFTPAASWQKPPTHTVSVPLTYHHEEIGRLVVATRSPEEPFSPADERLLAILAQLVAATVRAVQLNDELQQARERLVTAREEERRRLRRDLHDDLAPTLAGLSLTASTIGDLIALDPAKAVALAHKLAASIRATVGDIRRLVYDLRPPTLDELGLLAAIHERVAQYNGQRGEAGSPVVSIAAPEELPPLPAAIEVAAYRIVQEAVMNVERHAQARHCHISVTFVDALYLEISDDGSGIRPGSAAGVGLRSMRERAAELGGLCQIENLASGGTRIVVRLPIRQGKSNERLTHPGG
jgi:signal transduction histidine kinase